jgi:hypothetical protein
VTKAILPDLPREYLFMPTKALVEVLMIFWRRGSVPPHAMRRIVNSIRAELRRRELHGDPTRDFSRRSV